MPSHRSPRFEPDVGEVDLGRHAMATAVRDQPLNRRRATQERVVRTALVYRRPASLELALPDQVPLTNHVQVRVDQNLYRAVLDGSEETVQSSELAEGGTELAVYFIAAATGLATLHCQR